MREYGVIAPAFWTRGTGKKLRRSKDCRILATYLMTCPQVLMTGIYHLSAETMSHETGLSMPEVLESLKRLESAEFDHFAHFDEHEEVVWVPNLAREQVGETLSSRARPTIMKALDHFKKHRFHLEFIERYRDAYGFSSTDSQSLAASFPSSPSETKLRDGAYVNQLGPQEQEQEQEQEHCVPQRRKLDPGTTRFEMPDWQAAYTDGVKAGICGTWTCGFPSHEGAAMGRTIEARCPDLSKRIEWLRIESERFAKAVRAKPSFWSAYSPVGFEKWWNAGCPTEGAVNAPRLTTPLAESRNPASRRPPKE